MNINVGLITCFVLILFDNLTLALNIFIDPSQDFWARPWNKFWKLDGICFTNGRYLPIFRLDMAEHFVHWTKVRTS